MIKLALIGAGMVFFGNAYAADDPPAIETDKYALAQLMNYSACMETFAAEHALVDASPTEIAQAAGQECHVYHRHFVVRAHEIVHDFIVDDDDITPAQYSLNERSRKFLIEDYEQIARDQREAAISQALLTVIKKRKE